MELFEEFGYLLQESDSVSLPPPASTSRRSSASTTSINPNAVQLTSSTAFPGANPYAEEEQEKDPYAISDGQSRLQQYQEQRQGGTSLSDRFQSMDFQDLVITLFIPGLLAFVGGRWCFNRARGRVAESADQLLDRFARELLYHDGDVDEMQACVKEYRSKWVLGPQRSTALLKRYLETYAKQRKVSPQAIASLSTVFQMFGLTEAKSAKIMVELCEEMGTRQMGSIGALLFFGSRIFQSAEGKAALEPIKKQIMATYEDEDVGEQFLETAQA